ncbi:hypothetical protein PLICRDRAFT_178586 [Plicaturopsis crispa FD-325 SS-3]|nr:hypothetical protein PLICRDRAFT_178586 [Plicaturopsis crispa FD-325 SS-3]
MGGSPLLNFVPCVAILLVAWTYSKYKANPKRLPLPPGPKPLPLVGNIFDIPTEQQWVTYDRWCKEYGDIIHINILGQSVVILGSSKTTTDLFEKRSAWYSDRIRLTMLNELMGWSFNLAMMRYGEWWRRHRKAFHSHFLPRAIETYRPVQIDETRKFLRRLAETPEDFIHHIRHVFAAMIMKISYGIDVSERNDRYITMAEEAADSVVKAGMPGTYWVDIMPFLKHVPAWVPGAGFQRKAAQWKEVVDEFQDRPYRNVKDALAKGVAQPSLAVTLIENLPNDATRAEEEQIAKSCVAMAYVGGADTTVSAVQSFFLAMASHPAVQRKAQAELDAVVGTGRLPDFSDRSALPYISALLKEIMRWQPVTPLAAAHRCMVNDEYEGYFIPKGSIVIGNTWAILHDPSVYPDPEAFKPERFLKDGKIDPCVRDPTTSGAFGFGRRVCPGRHMSDTSLFIVVTSILAVFDIGPPRDEAGNPIQLKPEMTSGLISYPAPFQCVITPRSTPAAAALLDSDSV